MCTASLARPERNAVAENFLVIPAKAGTQLSKLDSRLRGNDYFLVKKWATALPLGESARRARRAGEGENIVIVPVKCRQHFAYRCTHIEMKLLRTRLPLVSGL